MAGKKEVVVISENFPTLSVFLDAPKDCAASPITFNPYFSDISLISIKATTTDYLGFIGKEQGIACLAVCLLNEGKIS